MLETSNLTYVRNPKRMGVIVPRTTEHERAETVGLRLKRLRLERGLSQRDLSSPGVSYAYISRIEAGARTPSVKALRMLARKLNVSVEYLETGRDLRESEEREMRLGDAELAIRFGDDTREAEQQLAELRDEALAAGDAVNAGRAEAARGFAAMRRGNHLDAAERIEQSLKIYRPQPHLRPDMYAALGEAYSALGAPDRAVRTFQDCLTAVREAAPNDMTIKTRFGTLLSYALSDAGDHERAAAVVREVAAELTAESSPYDRVRVYWASARSSGLEGRALEALGYIRRAIALLEATDNTTQLARGHLLAAGIEVEEGHAEETRAHLDAAESLLGPAPESFDVGMVRTVRGQLAALEGNGDLTVRLAREALDALGDYHGGEQGAAVLTLGRGLALQRDDVGASDAYRRAVDLLVVHGRRHEAAKAALEWGTFLRECGREEEAGSVLQRAADLGLQADVEAARKA
jgi:transcriptional regulator with XRE-family HTH domain